ncbi:unnamed protein product [Orchesella dallaii]|uniref:Angiotensin-converting enzyme n=1 Tax=Orchesella dallaii TaxID=48710 RepID=A0ABP1Q1A8_9HEXA
MKFLTILLFASAQIILTHSLLDLEAQASFGKQQVRVRNERPSLNVSSNEAVNLTEEEKLQYQTFLATLHLNENLFRSWLNNYNEAAWNYHTDLDNLTAKEIYDNFTLESIDITKAMQEFFFSYESYLTNSSVSREDRNIISKLLSQRVKLTNNMAEIYNKAKVCPYNNQGCDLNKAGIELEPDIKNRFLESTDYDELSYLWTAWRNATGRKLRGIHSELVDVDRLLAKKARVNSRTEVLLKSFHSPTFQKDCEVIWDNVKPLYEELHAYIRYKLGERYPSMIKPEDPIPAHLVSSMNGETFEGLSSLLVPFPNVSIDMDEELRKRFSQDLEGIRGMFETANAFFMSMGLVNMSVAYGPKAVLMKPKGKRVICHASSHPGTPPKIKMCAEVNLQDFMTIHHELGHIQHYMSQQNKTFELKKLNNPGFEEAIGDVISLSAGTPQHMAKIGLLENNSSSSKESTINYLMQVGLRKIVVLSFSYVMDAYRWKVSDGTIKPENWTYYWVKMRSDIQGLIPPVIRDEQDFDIGSKYHVANDLQMISYFVSHIIQFQLHKGLCKIAKQYPALPLHECDLYGSKEAGAQFRKILETDKWENFLEETIGENGMNASALLEYFSPLYEYLKEYRTEKRYPIGWSKTAFEAFALMCWQCETADLTDNGYTFQCHIDSRGMSVSCEGMNPQCYLQELRRKGTPVVAKVLRYCRPSNVTLGNNRSASCAPTQLFGPYESTECHCNHTDNCNQKEIAGFGGVNWGLYPTGDNTSFSESSNSGGTLIQNSLKLFLTTILIGICFSLICVYHVAPILLSECSWLF